MSVDPTLDPDQLVANARAETGLSEFDEPDIEGPLRILTRALREEARLTPGGRYFWSGRLHGILVTRLRGRDWVRRHPEILEERVPPPLVILGLSRTGTTLLHRLIAADKRFYSAAWWECRFPVPAPDDMDGAKRIAVAKAEVAAMLEANPDLLSIHPFDAMGADEDILLMDQTLLSTTSETMACIPGYYEWLRTQDLRPAYDYWYRTIQLLQWQKRRRGATAERWVLKTPMHLGHVDKIVDIFPDATFAQTHRDPVATIPSYASMIYELWRGVGETSDPVEAGRETSGTLEHDLNRCLAVREIHRHRLPRHRQGPRERRRADLPPHRTADDGHCATPDRRVHEFAPARGPSETRVLDGAVRVHARRHRAPLCRVQEAAYRALGATLDHAPHGVTLRRRREGGLSSSRGSGFDGLRISRAPERARVRY